MLKRGRQAYAESAWRQAYESLARADEREPLSAEDLELLATAAFMLGREDQWFQIIERASHAYAEAGERRRAARCAFWIGMQLALRGEMGPATGWLSRAHRLIEGEGECAEQGYLLMPVAFQHDVEGDLEGAVATAATAAEIGSRFGDKDLFTLAIQSQGEFLVNGGKVREGLGLLDEAMVAVTEGGLSPIVTGIVYCGMVLVCEHVFDLRRAREWTAALTRWCEQQPDLLAFTGRCLVHRAQILQLQGDWADALTEAERADRRSEKAMNQASAARACYLRGEVHRLRGEFADAEEAYRRASQLGSEPQPGLALLRLVQGNRAAAAASIRRVVGETTDRLRRASLLPAYADGVVYEPISKKQYEAMATKEADKILSAVKLKAEAGGVECDLLHTIANAPWEAILAAAKKAKCDAIVMASHGRRGVTALLLGSETQKVLTHSKLPVIVVR